MIGVLLAAVCLPALAQTDINFDRDVAPILIDRCLDCHSGSEPEGALNLADAGAALKGGETGLAIVAGKPDASLLWQRVSENEMPPKQALGDRAKGVLRRWIASGAKWGTSPIDPFRVTTRNRAGYDWWALQTLKRPQVPTAKGTVRNPIDSFVLQKLEQRKLTPAPEAAPQVLIRRLYFSLIGLPPSPEEVAEFEAAVAKGRDAALKDLVEKLLSSRHFGERWGRHWLDVARFGESQGFERDKLRTNSWHYRDWVINAINNDMPYNEFVRQQLAGDILYPNDPDAITATGFLVAGPWDEVGQSMRSAAMRAVVRQDEIEDYVGTIGQTFLGLTVNCARCHDHKFDPIMQKEYYQLASAVGGVKHGSRPVNSKANQQRVQELNTEIRRTQDQIARVESAARNRLLKKQADFGQELPTRVQPISRWDFEKNTNDGIGKTHATQHPKASIVDGRLVLDEKTGYAATHMQNFALEEKTLEAWVKLDDLDQRAGAAISVHTRNNQFDAIVFAERKPKKWMAGSDFFNRTKDLTAPDESTTDGFIHLAIAYHSDGTIACYRNGKPYGEPYQSTGPFRFEPGQWYVMFGLRTGGPHPNRQLRGLLEAAQLYDRALSAEEVLASYECEKAEITHDSILAALTNEERKSRVALTTKIKSLEQSRKNYQPHSVYAVTPVRAETAHVLLRGNPANRGDVVSPGGVASIAGVEAAFGLTPDSSDGERRRKLAEWITDQQNPLFARVIVNRLWHYHFGTGLVETPNDFGFNGGRPSHPELLDWLASELIESGWKLKHLHRLMVTSATYLQSSRHREECASVDADNRLLWRKSPMRLEAEALRDAILSVSGELNKQFGGPPYQDFKTFTNNTQFYEMIDFDKPDVYRRTVYRTWVRSGRNQFLDAFDCPDPSTTSPKRAVTTTPIQSLAMLNNSFVLRMSERFAQRVTKDAGDDPAGQARRVYQLAYGRSPGEAEVGQLKNFVAKHGLPALCRVILNSNEFIHVD